MNFGDPRLPERFWNKCIPEPMSGCWLWFGATDRGYGFLQWNDRKVVRAHRIAFLVLVGEIPKGLEIDHLCRVTCCCNPAHMEPVTHAVNMARGTAAERAAVWRRAITHCPRGHAYDESNTYTEKTGGRQCKACARDRKRAAYHEKKKTGTRRDPL